MKKRKLDKKCIEYGVITMITALIVLYLVSLLLGIRVDSTNPYNTYALQADSWRQGRLDLGQNYTWLELAIYEGKYFCSFPPFPSYLYFPLTLVFGSQTPDYFLMAILNILLIVVLYKLAIRLNVYPEGAMALTLMVTIGANTLFIMMHPYVWFIAQILCFLTSVLAIYCALEGKGGWCLFFWSAAVGCRPMQVIFLPALLLLMFRTEREKDAETPAVQLVLRKWRWAVPMGLMAVSYMLLNYLRFDSIMEFGHNYLPEHVNSEHGQFHTSYMKNNWKSLFHLPERAENGRLQIDRFGNTHFILISPIIGLAIVGLLYAIWKKEKELIQIGTVIMILSILYLLFLTSHSTMGGWHFGNRYTIDILPYIYLFACRFMAKHPGCTKYCIPLGVLGVCINIVGTIVVYNGLAQ